MADASIFRRDFRILAELRAEEARVLLRNKKPHGAYYLVGYAVECALKACVAKQRKRFEYPPKTDVVRELYNHKLNALVKLAGLDGQLTMEIESNSEFARNWNTVKEWTPESRYRISGLNARDMYNAVIGPNGVLPWIKLRW